MERAQLPIRHWLSATARTFASCLGELFPPIVPTAVEAAEAQGWHIDPPSAYCHRCGASTGPGEATERGCSHCLGQPIAWDQIDRLSVYGKTIAPWIVAMKYHKQWKWATWFGEQLARIVRIDSDPAKTIICPVPMPALRCWRRGFSQTQLIADAFAKPLELHTAPLLRRHGWQRSQSKMLASQRTANVRDAFRIEPVDLTGHEVWLIDDVKTTGSTLTACSRLLRRAGASRINVAVAAVADPKHADFKLK